MANVVALRDVVTGEPYFRETATDIMYRRIVGGLAWPTEERHGSVIVLGEVRVKGNVLDTRRDVHRLEERRTPDVRKMVDDVAAMQEAWLVSYWATATTDPRVFLLYDYNDERRAIRKRPIRYGDPQGWAGKGEGLIPFYDALVQRRTRSEKTLFFGDGCEAAIEISELEGHMGRKVTDFPAAAAAFFALAELDVNPMPEWGRRTKIDLGPADPVGGY